MKTAWCTCLLVVGTLAAQTLDDHVLAGKYYFRHVSFTTDATENITDIRSLSGSMTFDGAGAYTFTGQQTVTTAASTSFSGNGTYSVDATGAVTLSNPQRAGVKINARTGEVSSGEGMVIGSSTESATNTFDLLAAVQAPTGTVANTALNGTYFTASLEFPAASSTALHSGFFKLQTEGTAAFSTISVFGHSANANSGAPYTQSVSGATYTLMGDGSGVGIFPPAAGAAPLLGGNKNLYISSRGNVLLGGSRDAGVHDFLIGLRSVSGAVTNANWTDKFWSAGLRFESGGAASSFVGSANAVSVLSQLTQTQRIKQLQSTGAVSYDFTGVNNYHLTADGSGTSGFTQLAIGVAGNAYVGAAISLDDPTAYEIFVGVRLPALSGTGVFLNPQGVFNGGSFSPPGAPVSPGEFVALFGTGLSSQSMVAAPPYPQSLAGVSVTVNNRPAPLRFVSDTQINLLVPYATTEATAAIVVTNGSSQSNTVVVPVANTSPGVFSLNNNGLGDGAILHSDFSVVNAAHPAHPGETVLIFVTGLGLVAPPVADGTAGGSQPLNRTTQTPDVFIGGQDATVGFSGLAPGFPGLYQLNVVVPSTLSLSGPATFPLAVRTAESFHDQVDIALAP